MIMSLRYPPVSPFVHRILGWLLTTGTPYTRPVSVEHETRLRERKRMRRMALWILGIGVIGVFSVWIGQRGLVR